MKIINIFLLLIVFTMIVSCEDEEYSIPNDLTDIAWVTSFAPEEDVAVNINHPTTFMDLSRGTLSHEWGIGKGNFYLNDEYDIGKDSIFTPHIISSDSISEEALIGVLFTQPGLNKVRLYNTFPDSVSWYGSNPISSIKKGEVWVIDTTFLVDVYDSIRPAFDIYKGEELTMSVLEKDHFSIENSESWKVVDIESGDNLTFVDRTTSGRPAERGWWLKGCDPSSSKDSIFTTPYYTLGKTTAGKFVSSRGYPAPKATASKLIPLHVNVVASSKPFEYLDGSAYTSNDWETIYLKVTGVMASVLNEQENFTVHVENSTNGYSDDIPVQAAMVKDGDATVIELQLQSRLYNTDVVTVSYSDGGIVSRDERKLNAFGPVSVSIYEGFNLVPSMWGGFETSNTNQNSAFAEGFWVGNGNDTWLRTEDMANSGTACMSHNGPINGKTLQGQGFPDGITKGKGTYRVSLNVYIPTGTNIKKFWTYSTAPSWKPIAWDNLDKIANDTWVSLSQDIFFEDSPSGKFQMKIAAGDNPDAVGEQPFYVDDHSFIFLDERQ